MGLFDTLGKVFSPKNIGTALGFAVGGPVGAAAGRAGAHLLTGEDRNIGSTVGEALTGGALGAGATQVPGLGRAIQDINIPGIGGTPDVTSAATPPISPEGWSPGGAFPWEKPLGTGGGAANVAANIPGGSGEPGRLRRLLTWAEENPELAAGAVSGLSGLYGQYQQGKAEQAAAEYQMRRNEAVADVSAALFRGLAKQLPRAA